MPGDRWNPEQYARFRGERSQPFFDLVAMVTQKPGMRVVDLGCGPGELTKDLHLALQARETIGVDNSDAMLAKSGAFVMPGLSFQRADLRDFAARPELQGTFDLVLSNAALQWVPDQAAVLQSLTGLLAPGGQLAIQVPANEDSPSHATARAVAAESPFHEALQNYQRVFSNLAPEAYAQLLDRLGYPGQLVRLQVYVHRLPSRDDVVEWVKGSYLTDYQVRLSPELFQAYLHRYRELLMPQLDDRQPFLYPFKRILVWATRPE